MSQRTRPNGRVATPGSAAAALGATTRIRVGIGVLPVPLRNVALTAMELATLERIHPGRVVAGIGHGVQGWMDQVGARPRSPLTLLREYTEALQRLLAGETVTTAGEYVRLDDVRLSWPPHSPLALHLGGEGPRTLDLVGALGDGLVVPGGYSPDRLRSVVRRVEDAAATAGRPRPEVTTFLPCVFGADGEQRIAEHRLRLDVPADAPATEVWGDRSGSPRGSSPTPPPGPTSSRCCPSGTRTCRRSRPRPEPSEPRWPRTDPSRLSPGGPRRTRR